MPSLGSLYFFLKALVYFLFCGRMCLEFQTSGHVNGLAEIFGVFALVSFLALTHSLDGV